MHIMSLYSIMYDLSALFHSKNQNFLNKNWQLTIILLDRDHLPTITFGKTAFLVFSN